MEKICQIEAGKYLLAIKSSIILKTGTISSFLSEEPDSERPLILLASFFDQRKEDFPEADDLVMDIKTAKGSQLLVIDSFSEKSIMPDHEVSLPLLYPDFTKICCPQIVIYNEQPLLLLESDGLETVLALQKNDFATVSFAVLHSFYSSETEGEDMQSTAEFDTVTFNTIVSWAMGEFLKSANDLTRVIYPDDKLMEAISSRDVPAVDEDLLQELIDKTVQKCRGFHDSAIDRLKQASAMGQS